MTRAVLVAPEAERQIRTIDAWWRTHRQAAADLFEQELRAGLDTLASHPRIGRRVPHPEAKGLRRLLLRHTRYHVYYVPTDRRVLVLAVWSAVRGAGPDLTGTLPRE